MKTKTFLAIIGSAFVMALCLSACSVDDQTDELTLSATDSEGQHTCIMHWDAPAPGYDEDATRAATSWTNSSKVYLRMRSGNTYVSGIATYNSYYSQWTCTWEGSLAITSSSATLEAYYFENTGSVSGKTVSLTEQSVCYKGTGTYSHPTANDLYVNVTLDPMTWRLRFKGTSGQSITLDGSNSDLKYYSSFSITTGELSSEQKSVTLKAASNGFTPYVYGTLRYSGSNRLYATVANTSGHFERTVSASSLKAKDSRYCTIPTTSNYSSAGWSYVADAAKPNLKVTPNAFLPFTDGYISLFVAESNVAQWNFFVIEKSKIRTYTDAELINMLKNGEKHTKNDIDNYYFCDYTLSPNTEYVMVCLGYDSQGNHGELTKKEFKTNAGTLPLATVSNFRIENVNYQGSYYKFWFVDVSMKYNASHYYIYMEQSEKVYEAEEHYLAWEMLLFITDDEYEGQLGPFNETSSYFPYYTNEGEKYTVITWGVNSQSFGNFSAFHRPAKSNARAAADSYILLNKGKMKKDDSLREMIKRNFKKIKL